MVKKVHMIRKVVNPGRVKKLSEVMSAIEKWEVTQLQLQKQYAINLDGDLLTGILLGCGKYG